MIMYDQCVSFRDLLWVPALTRLGQGPCAPRSSGAWWQRPTGVQSRRSPAEGGESVPMVYSFWEKMEEDDLFWVEGCRRWLEDQHGDPEYSFGIGLLHEGRRRMLYALFNYHSSRVMSYAMTAAEGNKQWGDSSTCYYSKTLGALEARWIFVHFCTLRE